MSSWPPQPGAFRAGREMLLGFAISGSQGKEGRQKGVGSLSKHCPTCGVRRTPNEFNGRPECQGCRDKKKGKKR